MEQIEVVVECTKCHYPVSFEVVSVMLYKFLLKDTYIYISNIHIKALERRVSSPSLDLSSLHRRLAGSGRWWGQRHWACRRC